MKLNNSLGLCVVLSCVIAQINGQMPNARIQDRAKYIEAMKKLWEQRNEYRRQNTYKWTVVLDDQSKSEIQLGSFVNTMNKTIFSFLADNSLEELGYNRTVMLQDDQGLVAVIEVNGGRKLFAGRGRPFSRNGQIFFNRGKRQAAPNSAIPNGVVETPRTFTFGRGGRGRIGGFLRQRGLGQRGGQGRGMFGGQGTGQVRGFQGRGQIGQGSRPARRFRSRQPGGPCYIIPAKMTYTNTINKINENNVTGTTDVTADVLDFVASPTSMTVDEKSTFATAHPNLAVFCGRKEIFDAQTVAAGSDLAIEKSINALGNMGRFIIRIKETAE